MYYDDDPMGEYAETEIMIETALKYQRVENEAKEGIWTTGDGRKIKVEDMTDSHIRNTIAYIKRVDGIDMYAPWLAVFEKELQKREVRAWI